LKMAWHGGGKEGNVERRVSKLGDYGSGAGSAALFASSAATIFASIGFNSSSKANATLTPIFLFTGVCDMDASIGGAHRDGDGGSSRGELGSAAEREDCATTGLKGTAHGIGNYEPINDADQSAAEPIDRNLS
jgi:hypothetical protein